MIDALVASYQLKGLDRAGWKRVGIRAPESVAAHSWGISLLAMCLAPPELDRAKVLAYAALHDLPEAIAGDVTPHDGISRPDKLAAEQSAMQQLTSQGLPQALLDLWRAYEERADAESAFVHQLDKLDMAIQALAYQDRAAVAEFVASAAAGVSHPALTPLMRDIEARLHPDE